MAEKLEGSYKRGTEQRPAAKRGSVRNQYCIARCYLQSPYVADSVQWKPAFLGVKRLGAAGNLIRSIGGIEQGEQKPLPEDEVGQNKPG